MSVMYRHMEGPFFGDPGECTEVMYDTPPPLVELTLPKEEMLGNIPHSMARMSRAYDPKGHFELSGTR